jgi:hypothetical protein
LRVGTEHPGFRMFLRQTESQQSPGHVGIP